MVAVPDGSARGLACAAVARKFVTTAVLAADPSSIPRVGGERSSVEGLRDVAAVSGWRAMSRGPLAPAIDTCIVGSSSPFSMGRCIASPTALSYCPHLAGLVIGREAPTECDGKMRPSARID